MYSPTSNAVVPGQRHHDSTCTLSEWTGAGTIRTWGMAARNSARLRGMWNSAVTSCSDSSRSAAIQRALSLAFSRVLRAAWPRATQQADSVGGIAPLSTRVRSEEHTSELQSLM